MKTLAAGLAAHYAQGTTTLATCWRVTLTNGTVLGFTSFDADLTVDGQRFEARAGYASSAIDQQTRLATDNLETHGLLSDIITEADLLAGLWDFAAVEIFVVNAQAPAAGRDILVRGRLGEISHERGTFRAELRGLNNAYSQTLGQIYQPACRATLGDARCGVNVGAITVTGTLQAVSSDGLVLFDAARTELGPTGGKAITAVTLSPTSGSTVTVIGCVAHGFADGQAVTLSGIAGPEQLNGRAYLVQAATDDTFNITAASYGFDPYTGGGIATPQGDVGTFDGGKITMTSGASAGLSIEIKAYLPGQLTLHLQLPFGVAAGDTYSLVPGCGKRFQEDCVTRYGNGINFRGEPHLPGMDRLIQVGSNT